MRRRDYLRTTCLALLALLASGSATVLAQPSGPGGPAHGGEGWRRGNRAEWMQRALDRVAETLELDEEQRAQFDALAAEQREHMRELRQAFRAVREAEEAGDEERAETLRAELPDRPQRGWNPFGPVLDGLEPLLREDQLEKLAEVREQAGRRGRGRGPRLEAVAEELDLTEEQRTYVQELAQTVRGELQSHGGQWRALRPLFRNLREARAAGDTLRVEQLQQELDEQRPNSAGIISGFFDNVETILTEEQLPQFQAFREREETRRARFQQRMREGRGMGGRGREARPTPGEGPTESLELSLLDRIQESIDFGKALELDAGQREAFEELMSATRKLQSTQKLSEQAAAEQIFKNLRGILKEDQRRAFGTFREEIVRGRSADPDATDIRLVLQAARSLKLSKEQLRALREIQKNAAAEFRKVRKESEKRVELARTTKAQVVETLDDAQVERFLRRLERLERRHQPRGKSRANRWST